MNTTNTHTNVPPSCPQQRAGHKRLSSYITSDYMAASNHLRPQQAKKKVVVYVESFDDVFFWRSVLQEFETDTLGFEVMLPSRQTLCKGKKRAMMNQLGPQLGKYMIACVDADYDWLLQGLTACSASVLRNPYVIHTYVYAIENYQCYAPTLHTACVMSTLNDRHVMDIPAFLRDYSRIIWPLFVWSVWSYAHGAFKGYTLSQFCETVGFHDIHLNKPQHALEELQRRVNKQVTWLQRKFPKGKKTYPIMLDQLLSIGVKPEECYLYMQGHTLFNNVVMTLLTPLCAMLRKEREREIEQLAEHENQRMNELSCYHHSISPIDVMLRKSTNYRTCPAYKRMRTDIIRLLEKEGLIPCGTRDADQPRPES